MFKLFTYVCLFVILVIVVLQFGKDGAIQMEKRKETAFFCYFAVLFLLVVNSIFNNMDMVNFVYLVVVLSCVLKFIFIVNAIAFFYVRDK